MAGASTSAAWAIAMPPLAASGMKNSASATSREERRRCIGPKLGCVSDSCNQGDAFAANECLERVIGRVVRKLAGRMLAEIHGCGMDGPGKAAVPGEPGAAN